MHFKLTFTKEKIPLRTLFAHNSHWPLSHSFEENYLLLLLLWGTNKECLSKMYFEKVERFIHLSTLLGRKLRLWIWRKRAPWCFVTWRNVLMVTGRQWGGGCHWAHSDGRIERGESWGCSMVQSVVTKVRSVHNKELQRGQASVAVRHCKKGKLDKNFNLTQTCCLHKKTSYGGVILLMKFMRL